jgi:hypothetical protein
VLFGNHYSQSNPDPTALDASKRSKLVRVRARARARARVRVRAGVRVSSSRRRRGPTRIVT